MKTALLVALASFKRVGNLQAFSVDEAFLEFGPANSHVILRPRPGYVPKVPTTPFRDQVVNLQALPLEEADPALALLCPVRALRAYVDRTQCFRTSDQLFVCHGGKLKGKALSKQRLSHWIVDAIALAYQQQGRPCPLGVTAHSTRSVASSWALAHGASLTDICRTAGWATPNTFARFYNLRVEPVLLMYSLQLAGTRFCSGVFACSPFLSTDGIRAIFSSGFVITGRPLFQCLICVERYLAVVHPVTFLKALKQSGPGERRREKENCMKRRAFYIILITTIPLGNQDRVPQGSGPAAAEARRRSQTWGSQMDLSVDVETGSALSQPLSDRSSASHQGVEARAAVSSPPMEAPILQLSSSEELDAVSIDTESEDSPPQSHAFEELLDVVTRAVERLSIEWPEDSQGIRSKSKLDERFLPSRAQPQRRSLPFFPRSPHRGVEIVGKTSIVQSLHCTNIPLLHYT
ncbi:hypothetical protein PO909_002785 [Leuciscus waleckii]